MPSIVITAAQFEAAIRDALIKDTQLVREIALETALRGVYRAVKETNKAGSVDRGFFKKEWKAVQIQKGAELRNDSPYAGIIEYGRRAGAKMPPLEPIAGWVQRKILRKKRIGVKRGKKAKRQAPKKTGVARKATRISPEAWRIAKLIQRSIHIKGIKPRAILRKVATHLGPDFRQAAVRALRRRHRN